MSNTITTMLVQQVARQHGFLLQATRDVPAEHLTRWLAPTAPSMAWHLWHMARWADRYYAIFPAMVAGAEKPPEPGHQLWEVEDLAMRWGFDASTLGYDQSGMAMDDAVAAKLPLPNIDILHDYAHRAFAAVEQVFNAIEDRQLPIRRPDLCYAGYVERERTVCGAILSHLSHSSRHLGMIEALRGILLHKRGSMTF